MPASHIIDFIVPGAGIQRDGTPFDSNMCIDGVWTRFYQGRPKKIGGHILLDPGSPEIIRNLYNIRKKNTADCYLGRPSSLAFTNISNAISTPEVDRTPVGFNADADNNWTFDRYTQLNEEVLLGNNPLISISGTGTIIVTVPSTASLINGEAVTISGAESFNGIPAFLLNGEHTITILTGSTFSFSTTGSASSSGSGGGPTVVYSIVRPSNYVLAHAVPNVMDINSTVNGPIYWGNVDQITPLSLLSPTAPEVSGGIVVAPPYIFAYGNEGIVYWTLDPQGPWKAAAIAGSKIIKGMRTRGGTNSPSVLFWTLDSLHKATFIGEPEEFRFDTIQDDMSLLAQNSIVTHANYFYWIGENQFYCYTGIIKPIRNDINKIYFFEGLNEPYANKIWGEFREKYNEIWWHYPRYPNTECSDVVICNIEAETWYDTPHGRSAGITAGYKFPVASDSSSILNKYVPTRNVSVGLTNDPLATLIGVSYITVKVPSVADLKVGMTITIQGATGFNGLTAPELNIETQIININGANKTITYDAGVAATGTGNGGGNGVSYNYIAPNLCYGLWQEETGVDRVLFGESFPIVSYFETNHYSYFEKAPTDDRQMRVRRVEPDFVQKGPLELTVKMKAFPNSVPISSATYVFTPDNQDINFTHIDTVNMGRIVTFVFKSNVVGGDYQMGKPILSFGPGDVRP